MNEYNLDIIYEMLIFFKNKDNRILSHFEWALYTCKTDIIGYYVKSSLTAFKLGKHKYECEAVTKK